MENLLSFVNITIKNKYIIVNAEQLNFKVTKVISAYLILNKKVVAKSRLNNNLIANFKVEEEGNYSIKVFYDSLIGQRESLFFTEITYTKKSLPDSTKLKKMVSISTSNNFIVCDVRKLSDVVHRIVVCYLTRSGRNVHRQQVTNSNMFRLKILESGEYVVKVFYEDFDNQRHCISFDINFKKSELSSKEIKNITSSRKFSSLKLSKNILYAFIIREFQRKYDKGYFRYFSIILGPSVQLGIMVAIFTVMGRKTVVGLSIPLFILTGLLPYSFFTTAGNCLTIVSGNRTLLSYRQVKIIDVILSSILMELLILVIIFCSGLFICGYLGLAIMIYNPLSLMFAFGLLFFLTLGMAMILAVIGFYFSEFNYAIQVIFRALFYISGVFFSIENIPVQYQKYLLWNPLLQLIEFIRFSFVGFNLPHELSYLFLFKCTIIIFLAGTSLYFINRNKFMVNDRAR